MHIYIVYIFIYSIYDLEIEIKVCHKLFGVIYASPFQNPIRRRRAILRKLNYDDGVHDGGEDNNSQIPILPDQHSR